MSDYESQVRAYLADCRRAESILNPKYHPTEAGCLRLVYYRTPAEAQEIRQAFRKITGNTS